MTKIKSRIGLFAFCCALVSGIILSSCGDKEEIAPDAKHVALKACGTCGSYPVCCNSSSDPDGDGWGWESSASCIVNGSNAQRQQCSGGISTGGGSSAGSCPSSLSCPTSSSCGCYIASGMGANRRAFNSAGANREFLASCMMETENCNTSYAYGDNKTGDAFNAGACKQNWGMMRVAYAPWRGMSSSQYATSAQMNSNRSLDVTVYKASWSYYGKQKFLAGHRNGSSGLANPNTTDINNFIKVFDWGYNNIANHTTDDVRFWSNVPAI
jgi:hypothetical protein